MKISIRGLRLSLKRLLNAIQRGESSTIYSREKHTAKIIPIEQTTTSENDYGFGMWSDYTETTSVNNYLKNIRKNRKRDI